MKKKYFFFDVDGTLTTSVGGEGEVTEKTITTINKLREKGHFVAIATGRSYALAKSYATLTSIDNMVTNGGYGLCLDGKLIDIQPLDKEKCLIICEEATRKKLGVGVVEGDSLDYYCQDSIFDTKAGDSLAVMHSHVDPTFDFRNIKEFHKIYVSVNSEEELQLQSRTLIPYMRYHPNSIVFEADDKFHGIRRMMEYLQAPIEDVVVFGDGSNDISMFKEAPFSIAMGNAVEELKQLADYITKNSNEEGITYACEQFGWI